MTNFSMGNILIGSGALAAAAASAGLYSISGPGASLMKYGRSRARAIETDTELVDAVDVAVIGGGFVGTSAALYLAQRGVSVALFEKGVIAGEASGRSLGRVESQFQSPLKQDIAELSRGLWRELNALTGEETGYRPDRLVTLCESEEETEAAHAWLESVKDLPNGEARLVSAQEAAAFFPGASGRWKGALLSTGEGKVEPKLAAPGIALGARKFGARIYQNCAVRGLELEAGRVAGVVTEKGPVRARIAILAGGVWSPLFARSLGLDLPQFSAYATTISIEPVVDGPEVSATLPRTLLRREPDGGYSGGSSQAIAPITPHALKRFFDLLPALRAMGSDVYPRLSWREFWRDLRTPRRWPLDGESPFEQIRILEPETHPNRIKEGIALIQASHPAFREIKVREYWSGALMSTIDNMPVISEIEQVPGLIMGTGLIYGLTWGPAAGSLLADLATGKKPSIDIGNFRYERFIDGTKLEFRP